MIQNGKIVQISGSVIDVVFEEVIVDMVKLLHNFGCCCCC